MDSVSSRSKQDAGTLPKGAKAKGGKAKDTKLPARRQRRKTDVARSDIVAAARELFAEKGYSNTTTRDIALRAQASEVLIFRYFQSKANLFRETVVIPFEEELKAFLAANPPASGVAPFDQTFSFVSKLYDRLRQHGDSLIALVAARLYDQAAGQHPGSNFREYFTIAVEQMEGHLCSDGETPAIPLPRSIRIAFASVVATALFRDWIFADSEYDDKQIVEALSEFIVYAVHAPKNSELRPEKTENGAESIARP